MKQLLGLPDELLLLILEQLDDVYDLMRLSRVCCALNRLVRSSVLVVGDAESQSPWFKGISGEYIQLDPSDDAEASTVIPKYGLFIVEFSGLLQSTDDLICCVARHTRKVRHQIIEVFISRKGVRRAFRHRSQHWVDYETPETVSAEAVEAHYLMSRVNKTLFLGDSELELLTFQVQNEDDDDRPMTDLIRYGHEYEFYHISSLPPFWFTTSAHYTCRFKSKSIIELKGITNTSMTSMRLPPLVSFFKESELPNLRFISGVAIESGVSLKMFARYPLLEELVLQSAYTGDDALFESFTEHTVLPNLSLLSITGNSVSLRDISMPKLARLKLEIHASREREESRGVRFEAIQVPALADLRLEFSSLPSALEMVLNELSYTEPGKLWLVSNSKSFLHANQLINKMTHVKDLTMKYNDIAMGDAPNDAVDWSVTPDDPAFRLDLPQLVRLTLGKFDGTVLMRGQVFQHLTWLEMVMKIKAEEQRYVFDQEHYPVLRSLAIQYSNSYAHLQDCNIQLVLDIKDLDLVFTRQPLPASNVEYKQLPQHMRVYLME